MTSFEQIKTEAEKMADKFRNNDFSVPETLPFDWVDYFILGKLADLYYRVKTGALTRTKAVEEQKEVKSLWNYKKSLI